MVPHPRHDGSPRACRSLPYLASISPGSGRGPRTLMDAMRLARAPRPLAALLVAGSLMAIPLLSALGSTASAADAEPIGGPLLTKHGTVVKYSSGVTKLPPVVAESWVLADATTGEILAAKAPHLRHRPASTLKTLTAVTVMPRLDKKSTYLTVDGDVNMVGSRAGIVPNAPYTIDQLFYAMFLPSGNDAATALARATGSVKSTVALMNAEARYLHARDTKAVNPTGLDADGQYSSAYDLALFARAGLAEPDFRRYMGALRYQLPGKMPKKGHKRSAFQINTEVKLLVQGYTGLIGGKTGWTTLAGRTFMAAAERNGHVLIVTLMGIRQPSADAARSLLNWGFHNVTKVKPVGVLVAPGEVATTPATSPSTSPSASTAAPSGSATKSSPAVAGAPSTASGSGHLVLIIVGGLLVLAGLFLVARTLLGRRRRGTDLDRLVAVGRRWNG